MIPDIVRLKHILDAAAKIARYGARERSDEITLDAIIYQLAIIGEASRHLSPALRKEFPAIPWKDIVGLRNLIVHEYYILSAKNIWSIVDRDIPHFKPAIESILQSIS